MDITGAANSAATVSVNEQAAVRKGDYFYKELAVDNSAAPVNQQVNVVGARQNFGAGGEDAVTAQGGRVFVPPANELFTYDADGNMTSDGRWNYTWDAENRLASIEALPNVPAEAKLRLEFAYDYMGRRVQKKVYSWSAQLTVFQLQSTTKFVYDGWGLVAELDGNSNLLRSYVWEQDISGALQGAGGIDGLLLINEGGNSYQAGYDGNGNLITLVKGGTGTLSALYDYDPFGNTLQATGEYASRNAFKFSTKYADVESGFIYYGYRYYNPQIGGWISRDPSGEDVGLNLYGFNFNDALDRIDSDGRASTKGRPAAKLDPLRINVLLRPPSPSPSTDVEYKVRWSIINTDSGWIIQHLKFQISIFDIKGNKLAPGYPDGLEYWEGWQVVNGKVYAGSASRPPHQADTFQTGYLAPTGTKGTLKMVGKVMFMKDYVLKMPPWGNSFREAGDLPTRNTWFLGWDESKAQAHDLTVMWDFCKSPGKVKVTARP